MPRRQWINRNELPPAHHCNISLAVWWATVYINIYERGSEDTNPMQWSRVFSNILVPRGDPILHTTCPCWLQRPVYSSAIVRVLWRWQWNQLLDQRCRHNIKIICNLSSRDPAAQTTVHCPQERQWEQYIWGVKGSPSPTMSPALFPLASLLVKYNIRNKNWC